MRIFYESKAVPVHSVLLLPTKDEALNYPRGEIALGFCQNCGFIANVAFDPGLHEYSVKYEATQRYSATFDAFSRRLAAHLVERHSLYGKDIIEIGCGQGEFLTLLCELGDNHGVGFDPAYVDRYSESDPQRRATFVQDFYSERYAGYRADFFCCKMTLEHIHNPADFVRMVRRAIGDRADTIAFFQVPDVARILRELAFWDIYYEHCSYFSLGSLAHLFRQSGFDVIDLWKDYGDQYLMIEVRPSGRSHTSQLARENGLEELTRDVVHFSSNYRQRLDAWQRDVHRIKQDGKRVVIWGAGSKGVAFLTTLGLQDEVRYAVDINPHKHGTYMAGTGQEIVAPELLRAYRPDVVIAMNPIYCDEIRRDLDRMGITAELRAVHSI
jgi:SAM-dependent methyltransferase